MFPEKVINIFEKYHLIFRQNFQFSYEAKLQKVGTFPRSDFNEINRKPFFYQYHDPVQISYGVEKMVPYLWLPFIPYPALSIP